MSDFLVSGILILILAFLTVVWVDPFIRPGIETRPKYRIFKAGVYLGTGICLLILAGIDPTMDLFMILRISAGLLLLYEGVVTVLNMHDQMKTVRRRGL